MQVLQGEMKAVREMKNVAKSGLALLRESVEEDMADFEHSF